MSGPRIMAGLTVVLLAALGLVSALGDERAARRSSLATFEGVVRSIESVPSDQGAGTDVAWITIDHPEPRDLAVKLAPHGTLEQIEFDVQVGDRLKVRVFLSDEQPVLAHRVQNLTRGTMVRLRTLTRIPLWDGRGQWQGGPCLDQRGGPGRRGPRGGRGGR